MLKINTKLSSELFCIYISVLIIISFPIKIIAQKNYSGMLRFEYGFSEIHRPNSDGNVKSFHLSRSIDKDRSFHAEGGLVVGSADEGFGYFDLGIEWRPLKDFLLSPFIGAGGGFLIEPEYIGDIFRVSFGSDINIGSVLTLRYCLQRGIHGGAKGPHLMTIGLGIRSRYE